MGKDDQPKHRQHARDLRRRAATRAPIDRLLIVCEGAKSEPLYFNEIRVQCRLPTANVQVLPGALGTQPLQIVQYAETLLRHGDRAHGIEPRSFDRVFVVFDRDEHPTYSRALDKAAALDRKIRNDERRPVPFTAIASVPCFELWLLLHFEDVHAPIDRAAAYERLRVHLPGYEKGGGGCWPATRDRLSEATDRARARARVTNAYDGNEPFTGLHELVDVLVHLKG
ncbi:MAG: RloB family protein [Burkholderiaceae bacterium]|nr:RloB family protein [Burkholderiaceae bacterium]